MTHGIDPRDDLAWRRERNAEFKAVMADTVRKAMLRWVEDCIIAEHQAQLIDAFLANPQKTANSPAKDSGKPAGGVSGPGYPTLAEPSPEPAHASPNDARGRGLKGEGAC